MSHDHAHDTDTYYLDQLCMIGITGAFAGICLTLYFFNTEMLGVLLQEQFHIYILLVGIALTFMVLVRAVVLWQVAGQKAPSHNHEHEHENCGHDHDHGHHHHDHDHNCHHHNHDHAESASQPVAVATMALPMVDHSHDDHDHSWAPWRYVILLVPLMLYLLGLPTRALPLTTDNAIDVSQETAQLSRLVGGGTTPLAQAAFAGAMTLQGDDAADLSPAVPIEFKQLEQLAFDPNLRRAYDQKKVQVVGQYVPYPNSDRAFSLSRLRIQCCAADAVQINVPILCRESVKGFSKEDWVRVTGRIEFREQQGRPGIYRTVLVAGNKGNIAPTNKDPRPYIQ
jgi:hypothetical protein